MGGYEKPPSTTSPERYPLIFLNDRLGPLLSYFSLDAEERSGAYPEGTFWIPTSLEAYRRDLIRGGLRGIEQGFGIERPHVLAYPLRVENEYAHASPFNGGRQPKSMERKLAMRALGAARIAHAAEMLAGPNEAEANPLHYAALYDAVGQYYEVPVGDGPQHDDLFQQVYEEVVHGPLATRGYTLQDVDMRLKEAAGQGRGGVIEVLDGRMIRHHGITIGPGDYTKEDCSLEANLIPLNTVIGVLPIGEYERGQLSGQ